MEKKLDSLDGGYGCFGDGSGNTTSQEVLGEGNSCLRHLRVLSNGAQLLSSVGFACGVEMADSNLEERGFKKTEREKTRELLHSCLIGWSW